MSGIYIHIPFCKKACHYCNFHFSTSLKLKDEMVDAICKEIILRHEYLKDKTLQSIYFGGGTPSLLDQKDMSKIMEHLARYYHWAPDAEITLEANPDDLNKDKIQMLKNQGINRLSIGVQSFFDTDLQWMNRAHHSQEALQSIQLAQDHGIHNITIDLIYGSPTTTMLMWEENVAKALSLKIPHISSYCLTVEDKTALHHHVKTGKSPEPDPEKSNQQFAHLINTLVKAGYDHYEISNFGIPGHHAVHNTNYWKGVPYLGLGPSAHSYDGSSRSWNLAHNQKYIDLIQTGSLSLETEILSQNERYNEYIMTGLRTMWGVSAPKIREIGPEYFHYFSDLISGHIQNGMISQLGDTYTLTHEGKFYADRVAMELFWVEE
jgi:oxygen-independent coproporphyrinogen III oxidase